ncbi:accessory gland protein Acp63F [Drosophila ficusphila]|uniref:accessory gland protein Acp63F n=1 Tax=Drosophila ficusphila TaxID=30025 RepID=UPI0007E7F2FA|nr:accessory gland protein Acp63F [Drosophila ficusphila]
MRNFSFVFILAVFVLGINGKCSQMAALILAPVCGVAADCYLNADNRWVFENQSCERKEKGLPPFLEMKSGKCPTDKPSCGYI